MKAVGKFCVLEAKEKRGNSSQIVLVPLSDKRKAIRASISRNQNSPFNKRDMRK